MNVVKVVSTYLVTTTVFVAIDMAWLGFVARDFYRRQLGPLLARQVNWPAAIAFHLLFIAGILTFVVYPAIEKNSFRRAVALGGLFGLVTYATYDLTNLATLPGFPPIVVAVDLVRGIVITGTVSTVGFLVARKIG